MNNIPKSYFDIEFRRAVVKQLDVAQHEVFIVTGEFSAFYKFMELQWAVKRAVERGVKFSIYFNDLPPGVARKLIRWGCMLYKGKRKEMDHFMLVDGNCSITSEHHTRGAVGERHGAVIKRGTAVFRKRFETLAKEADVLTQKTISGPDPLKEYLSKPVDAGRPISTDNLDGELI
jgi:hypothetical protein